MKDTIRLNFDFPRKYYPELKMILAGKGVSLKDFASGILIDAIEKAEDELLAKRANERLANIKEADLISFDEAMRLAGWDDDKA